MLEYNEISTPYGVLDQQGDKSMSLFDFAKRSHTSNDVIKTFSIEIESILLVISFTIIKLR